MTDAPKRIQRKRAKGSKMPEGAVYVGRGTIWGNPFRIGQRYIAAVGPDEQEVREVTRFEGGGFIATLGVKGREQPGVPLIKLAQGPLTAESACSFYRGHILETVGAAGIRAALRGKNLACFCPLDQPCHADVLLEIANR